MRALTMGALAISVTLAGASAAVADWREDASPFDQHRLASLDESKAKGLSEASAGRDIGLIHAVLDPAAGPAPPGALIGNWHCRTIKLGGMTPDVVYSWFNCRIGGSPWKRLEQLIRDTSDSMVNKT